MFLALTNMQWNVKLKNDDGDVVSYSVRSNKAIVLLKFN